MMPLWIEVCVAVLLVLSSMFALIGAIGLLRMKDFFQRMHPPALASTLGPGAWRWHRSSIFRCSSPARYCMGG
jgi:multicomponent K+:H+ antiporter subunit G